MTDANRCLSYGACILFALALGLLQPGSARARDVMSHTCAMAVGPYQVQFTGYAPETRPSGEFCESIPYAGKTIIAFDQVDAILKRMAMEIRIVRDDRRLGAGARHDQLGDQRDIEAATLFYKGAEVYSSGNATAELAFDKGDYLGVVTLYDPVTRQKFASVFPFSVGYGGFPVSLSWLVRALFIMIVAAGVFWVIEREILPPTGRLALD
jgi:hypothetical protein